MSTPGRHPAPPPDLAFRKLPLARLRGPWFRIHRVVHGAIHFGKQPINRFDAPAGEFGVLYVARTERGAFIETFGETFGHDTGIRVLDHKEVDTRALSRIDVATPLRLVDLRGPGLARLGADGELVTGAYALSQAWALALHDHPSAPDGIVYRARHDPSQVCAALFERTRRSITTTTLGAFSNARLATLLAELLDVYDFGLV